MFDMLQMRTIVLHLVERLRQGTEHHPMMLWMTA